MSKLKINFHRDFFSRKAAREENQVTSYNDVLCFNLHSIYQRAFNAYHSEIDLQLEDEAEIKRPGTYDVIDGKHVKDMSIANFRMALKEKGMGDWNQQTALLALLLQTREGVQYRAGKFFSEFLLEATNNTAALGENKKISVHYKKVTKVTVIEFTCDIATCDIRDDKAKKIGDVKMKIKMYAGTPVFEASVNIDRSAPQCKLVENNIKSFELSMNSKEWKQSSSAKLPRQKPKKGIAGVFERLTNWLNSLGKKLGSSKEITLKPGIHKPVIKKQAEQDIKEIHEVAESKPTYSPVIQNKVEIAQRLEEEPEVVTTPRNSM
jgi:hypothetical protein